MRLGGPVEGFRGDPKVWVAQLTAAGYRAAYAPVGPEADDATVAAFVDAAGEADIVIAETGARSNPLSADPAARTEAIEKCKANLDLAERLGAKCCVNISGSRGEPWDGPHPDNLTGASFEMIVAVTREIIDAVGPQRTCFALETMPWMYPDSVESYEALLSAVDREHFGVHFDPVNLVCSPQRYFGNGALIGEFVARLGPHIKSCHAKDILLSRNLTTHLDEVVAGEGGLDYACLLRTLDGLHRDLPLMLEHLPMEKYPQAAGHIRMVAHKEGVAL